MPKVRFDERTFRYQTQPMKHADLIEAIQLAYPQVWFACHIEHRTRSQDRDTGLTDREAGLLAHIGSGQHAASLAQHLGIGKASLSQHLKSLMARSFIATRVDPADRRRKIVELTTSGRAASAQSSPLDGARLERLLDLIPVKDRRNAVAGLQCLADAARRLRRKNGENSP